MSISDLKRQPADQPFNSDPKTSFTLPARFYLEASIYRQEQTDIFFKNWWYAGHVSQLPNVGDYLTTQIADQSVFVVRDRSGEIRAFYNVCQHRGHELVAGSGQAKLIVCPYHAWSYNLDGSLVSARNTEEMPGFSACEFSLKSVQAEIFCGLVFINLDPNARPLREQASGLEKEIRQFCPEVDEIQFARRDRYEVSSNWKVMIDNFLECYHCDPAHRDFVDLVDMKSYRSETKGIYSSHISNTVKTTDSAAYKFQKGSVDFGYAGWFLWPNITLWAYPGEPNLSVLQMIPDGPDRTIEYQDWFVPDGVASQQIVDAMNYQRDVLQPEDIGVCESVQRGLKSNGYNQGRFVTDNNLSELSEHAVHHFQVMVADALNADLS